MHVLSKVTQCVTLIGMATYHRPQVDELCKRLNEPPHHLIAIYGPRQAGKTTIVLQALERLNIPHHFCSTDQQQEDTWGLTSTPSAMTTVLEMRPSGEALIHHWRQARELAVPSGRRSVLVLDEIHAVPRWSQIVKGLWDEDRRKRVPLHVVLLGSAPLPMQTGLAESLMGRFEPLSVPHWSFSEMAQAFGFDLNQYVFYGGYPGNAPIINDDRRWREYITLGIVKPTIDKDLLSLVRVDKPALMQNLLGLCADYSGQILSYHKMLGQLATAGNTTTLARYLQLLSDAGLARGFERYSHHPRLTRASSPKLNVLNTALMTAITEQYTLDQAVADRTFWGHLVETAVGAHLVNSGSNATRVYYWRDGILEVDFVLKRGPEVIAIEVKSGRKNRRTRGMDAFAERFNPTRTIFVGGGGIAIDDFLSVPADHWFDAA